MAAQLSRSWSFFSSSNRSQSKDYLSHDYQPETPRGRVNLQERFSMGREWRTGPLPPPPTTATTHGCVPEQHRKDFHTISDNGHNRHLDNDKPDAQHHHSPQSNTLHTISDHVACGGAKPNIQPNPLDAQYPRKPLCRLPSGVAPLWNNLQGNVRQLKPQTSKIFHEGGRKVNRAMQGVKSSITSFSQMFRSSTRRRYKLDGGTPTRTPSRNPRRTPGKLYTPFNINTPPTPYSYKMAKRLQKATPRRNIHGSENPGLVCTPQRCTQWPQFSSPSQSLKRDTAAMKQGLRELEHVTSGIIHNGKGKWTQFR